ncbi:MAG: ABC transporter substrate-binding protein [Candidatus Binatia bacterium]
MSKKIGHSVLATILLATVSFSPFPLSAQDWLPKAQEEKKVVLYHTTNVPDTQKILEGFRKRYPLLEVETYRATGEKLFQKIITEVRAGRNLADVYIISWFQAWLLKDGGYLAAYRSSERERVNSALRDRDGFWTGIYWNLESLTYNTKLVSPKDVPRRWDELLNPRWKGSIGLEEEDINWYAFLLHLMGEEKGKDFMRKVAAQKPLIRRGHTLLAQLIAAGEFALAPTIRVHLAETLKSQGAPVEWHAIEPIAPNPPVSVTLPKNAPHPHAARVFIDFILSREGQEILRLLHRNPSRTDVEQPVPRAAKVKLLEMDWEKIAKNYGRYAKEFREIFAIH